MIDAFSRTPEPSAAPERQALEAWLDFHRDTLLSKCTGLDLEQLTRRAAPPSELTLLGLLQHMTIVETWWFDTILLGGPTPELFHDDADADAEFHRFDFASPGEVATLFRSNCQRSRENTRSLPLETRPVVVRQGEDVDLRWIYLHMIEEYARHNGHADLLREAVDGSTGL